MPKPKVASKKPKAVTQPKAERQISEGAERVLAKPNFLDLVKAASERLNPLPPWSLLSRNVPYVDSEVIVVCKWNADDGSWEELLVNTDKHAFYLAAEHEDENTPPAQITTSHALQKYAEWRALDCDHGSLDWPNLGELLTRAVGEVRFAEQKIGKRGAK